MLEVLNEILGCRDPRYNYEYMINLKIEEPLLETIKVTNI